MKGPASEIIILHMSKGGGGKNRPLSVSSRAVIHHSTYSDAIIHAIVRITADMDSGCVASNEEHFARRHGLVAMHACPTCFNIDVGPWVNLRL